MLVSGGLKFEIIFDESTDAYGTITRTAEAGTDGCTLFSVPVKSSGGSITEVMAAN